MKKSFLFEVSAAVVLALLATGCPQRECTADGDCSGRGAGWVCSGGTCTPPSSGTCEPACGGATPICEASTKTCKACTSTAGCSGATPVCDTAANGGVGACVTCTATVGCSGSTPVCDVSVAGGQCVGCLSDSQCGGTTPACDTATKRCVACTATAGCSGSTPVCDTAANGGNGLCKTCTPTAGCGGATPVCDPDGNGGAGKCVTCTATSGCSGATPVCDTSVAGGQCVACLDNSSCGGSTPVCNPATRTCVTCTATSGCSGATPVCDTSVAGGQCVACLDNSSCGGATPVCNTTTRTCVTCTATQGCSGATPVCDTSVAGGQCVGCLSDASCGGATPICDTTSRTCKACTDTRGCGGATPACDTAANGGRGVCVQCLNNSTCGGTTPVCDTALRTCKACLADNTGCAAPTPVCNAGGAGGLGECVECLNDSTCTSATAPHCNTSTKTCKFCLADNTGCDPASSTPYCDTTTNAGLGTCEVCTPTQGCTPPNGTCRVDTFPRECRACGADADCAGLPLTPYCDVANGACVECTSNAQCGGATPICDTAGQRICVACLADNTGCSAPTPACKTTANGGRGQCVECVNNGTCSGTTPYCNTGTNLCRSCLPDGTGCSAPTPACDDGTGTGTCVECVDNTTCSAPTAVCDTGAHVCRTCLAGGTGCSAPTPACNTAGNGGNGQCVECVNDSTCSSPTNHCDTSSFDCKVCLGDNTGCSGGTPVCDVSGGTGDGACVVCTPTAGCAPPTPACNTSVPGGQCVACVDDSTCAAPTPVCDSGAHACRVCLADGRGCSGTTPNCDVSGGAGMGACVECASQAHCAPTLDCDLATHACVTPPTPPATTSSQIAAVRAEPDGMLGAPLPIQGALVTYKRPLVGTDVAGFFIQAEQTGPAIFVAMDPDSLSPIPQVGDRVDMSVLSVATVGGGKQVNLLTDFAVLSSGHPIAQLAQNVSVATDLISNLAGYESEVVRIDSATVLFSFSSAGSGFVSAQISTEGYPTGNTNLRLRIPDTLRASMDLDRNCVVSLNFGPMWRFNAQAQPSAYGSELSATCPAPTMLGASAGDSTHVSVSFSRQILPSSVSADGSQFAITGLSVLAATVNGSVVTLTTGVQTPGTTYSLSAAGTVTDLLGTPVVTPNSADFTGYQSASTGLKINEVDYDQPGTDNNEYIELYNNGTTAVPLAGLAVVLVNGSTSPSPEYLRIDLTTAVDENSTPVTSIAPGGYLVIASNTVAVPNGVARIRFGLASNNIQNGGTSTSPSTDGVALVDTGALTVLDALSYEGSITSANITGFSAPVSLVEGTPLPGEDSGTVVMSMSRIPNGADTNNAANDWSLTTTLTPGTANVYTP